ncbi:MAG: hypothetical protein ACYC2O_11230 [Microthrixaceae bacterium]
MTGRWRSRSSTTIDRAREWLWAGLVRGCVTGALAPVVAGVVALAVVVLRPREPLPPGTTTSSTQTTFQAFAALFYLSLALSIVVSVGVVVGAAIGFAVGTAAAALDAVTRRILSPALVGAVTVLAAACVAEALLLVVVAPRWDGSLVVDGRVVVLVVALPFLIAGIGLWLVPIRRGSGALPPAGAGRRRAPVTSRAPADGSPCGCASR